MEHGEVLHTLAEVSVAFAGFTGVVAVFGRRDPAAWSLTDRARFRTLIEVSLFALLFCVVPSCLAALDLPEQAIWRTASSLFAGYLAVYIVVATRRARAILRVETSDLSRPAFAFLILLDLTGVALNLYNAAAVGEIGPFLLALVLLLVRSGFLFARMLLLGFRGEPAT